MDQHNVIEMLDDLYGMISEAWGVPLGNDKCIIEREKALELISNIKAGLPTSIAEAKRLVAARDEFIDNAKKDAEAMRKSAEEKARLMVEEQEVMRVARARSAEMMASAEAKSKELRRLASNYVDDLMRRTQDSVSSALQELQSTREAFKTTRARVIPLPSVIDLQIPERRICTESDIRSFLLAKNHRNRIAVARFP